MVACAWMYVGMQLAEALDHTHSREVVHLDVSCLSMDVIVYVCMDVCVCLCACAYAAG